MVCFLQPWVGETGVLLYGSNRSVLMFGVVGHGEELRVVCVWVMYVSIHLQAQHGFDKTTKEPSAT